ncbi:MAG: leucine-rich repeat protein [Eubacterium sp.]|nr:leucine-rich repeat protein [Eubacterium sp.]MBP3234941.1 leucine-rich repeat protein [Eubacterium sp.]
MIEKKQEKIIILRLLISIFTLLGLIIIPGICVNAETVVLEGGEEAGYVVEYDADTEECVVTFTTNNGVRDWKKTELNYETNQFESIAEKYADKITKVVIGKDLTAAYIDGAVISGFSKLQTIEVDPENTRICVEDNIVYNFKKGAKGNEMLLLPMSKCTEEYTLPEDVKVIGEHLFDNNTVVKKLIAKDIATVGSWAFNKSSIQEFECNTLQTISYSGFQYAADLEKITIKSNGSDPVSLSDSAFEGCSKLKEFP